MKMRMFSALSLVVALVIGSDGLPAAAHVVPAAPPPVAPWLATGPVTAAASAQVTQSNQVSVEYTFQEPVVERAGEYDRVVVPGLHNHGEPGAPVLPFKTANILLPYNTELEEVEVIAGAGSVLEGSYRIEPGQELRPVGSAPAETGTPPDPAIYGSTARFPGELFFLVSVQKLTGYTVLLLKLYPVQYVPATGELAYYESLSVNVTTTPPTRTTTTQPNMLRAVPGDVGRVQGLVDNPQTLDTYTGAMAVAGGPSPLASLVDAGDPCDYVLITSEALSSTFQTLVDWKISKGLEARIFTTEDIYANYTGNDDPDAIRNFIVDAYTTWAATDHPLEYVVLGGDDEIIPIRSIYVQYSSYSTWMPVDLYYGGLDGDWDADGDGNYGEPAGTGAAGEECDFFAEVYVGRMTVDNAAEAANIVSKTLDYEQNPTADYLDRALWLGRQLNSVTWGGNSKDVLAALIPQYNVTSLYDRDGTYSTSDVIAEMNAGTHLVNFDGHGNWSCCPLTPSQVDGLTNDEYFLFYNLGCNTAYFDRSGDEAVAEHYVFTEHGGFAYIGNTRYGWYSPGSTNGPGNQLDRLFFDIAVNTDDHDVGKALQLAKEDYYPGHRWSILTLTLLGDPETPLVSELPVPVADITAPGGGTTIKHGVDVVGVARAGDAAGATFDHYLVEHGSGKDPGSWTQIGATSYTTVTNGTLAAWDTTVLEDGIYTVRLTVDDGGGATSSDRAIVTADNFYITAPAEGELVRGGDVLTITGSALGTDFQNYVLEYEQGSSPGSWTFMFSSTVPVTDGVLLAWDTSFITEADDYTIRLTRNGTEHVSTGQVTVYIDPTWQAGWPQAAIYRIVAPSMAVGDIDGDGDFEIVATEGKYGYYSTRVYAWHHDGTPVAGWPRWVSGARVSAPALADIDRDGDLEIIVGSYDKKVYAWHHDGTVVSGWPQQTEGEVHASPAVADLDGDGRLEIVAGSFDEQVYVWHYDGTTMAGWPQAAGGQLHASPALGDIDGDGDMEIVAAREGSVYAWQHDGGVVAGWPVSTTAAVDVVASPALGDIAGDGRLEVVLGAGDQVYAWHHDGITVTGWPQTAGGTIKSSPALGDLDDNGDLEIVVGSDQVYAWHGDGAAVTGWPVTVTQDTNSSPVLGDITGDGDVEVVIGAGDEDGHIYAWQRDGAVVAGWPRRVPAFDGSGDHFERLASPILADVDQDGDVEVVIGAESHVIIHDLPATYDEANLEWPIFQHDLWLTGWYTSSLPNLPPFVRDVQASPWYVAPGNEVVVTAKVTDEDGVASVTAEIESPDETVHATLTLHDDGLHDDGAAGDDIYGVTWTTPLTKQDYLLDVAAVDVLSHACAHDNVADFTTQDVPYVQYYTYTINRESLDSDGFVSPDEFVECSLTLENLGVLTAPSVTATLFTDDEHIWWYNTNPITFGNIITGSAATSGDYDFFFHVSRFCPHGHTVTFDLTIDDALGHTWADSFDVTIIDNVGPVIHGAYAEPRQVVAGQPVTITAYVEDSSGISYVQAIIESPDETPVITLTLYDDGAHGDWGAGDGTYGNVWTTGSLSRIYYVDFATGDELGNVRAYDDLAAFTTQTFGKTTDILLFADYGGSPTDSFRPYYTAALDAIGAPYDLWDSYFYGPVTTATLQLYETGAVLWAVPYWGYVSYTTHRENLSAYLDAGGKLFISGQDVGQYIGSTGFYSDYLHASYVQGAIDSLSLGGVPGDPIGDGLQLAISGGDGADNQTSPDEIAPLALAATVFTYTGSASGGAGAVRVDTGVYRVVYFSFGFEAINSANDREIVMQRVLCWLLGPAPPEAAFTAPSTGWVDQEMTFTNTTVVTGDVAYRWAFGDGVTSTLESPTHTYTAPGVYTVVLTATNLVGSDVVTGAVTIGSLDEPPTISDIPDQATEVNIPTGPVTFTVGDVDTPAGDLTLSGESSNTTLVLTSAIAFGGAGITRTVTITPTGGLTGTAIITVTVSDGVGSARDAFELTVNEGLSPRAYLPLVLKEQ